MLKACSTELTTKSSQVSHSVTPEEKRSHCRNIYKPPLPYLPFPCTLLKEGEGEASAYSVI